MGPFRSFLISALLASTLTAQGDPFVVPQEVKEFARTASANKQTIPSKLRAILHLVFLPKDQGGLGMEYDATYTRSVAEVWRDRKANCLSLTAFYVAACRTIGIEAKYAEAMNTNRWRKVGNLTRFERHVVAVVRVPGVEDLVADFLPFARRRFGLYLVEILPESRLRALYFSNRAVELMGESKIDEALAQANTAVSLDPTLSVGWNILGAVEKTRGALAEAEKHFKKALTCDPKDVAAIGNMENLLRENDRAEEAAQYRKLGLEVRKKDPYFQAFLAEEALNNGDVDEAERQVKIAIRLHDTEPEFYLLLARLQLLKGLPEDAVKAIEKARRWASPGEQERYNNKLEALKQIKPGE